MKAVGFRYETVLEKVARCITRQYGVDVGFEGNMACTDGKTIILPYFETVTEELYHDLQGYLDHESGHVIFTDFKAVKESKEYRFGAELLNAVEDERMERCMVDKYPGCQWNLDDLNAKWKKINAPLRELMPWPIRLMLAIREEMARDWQVRTKQKVTASPVIDDDIKSHWYAIYPEVQKLNNCRSTGELLAVVESIRKIIKEDRQREQQGKPQQKRQKGKGQGQPQPGGQGQGKPQKGQSGQGGGSSMQDNRPYFDEDEDEEQDGQGGNEEGDEGDEEQDGEGEGESDSDRAGQPADGSEPKDAKQKNGKKKSEHDKLMEESGKTADDEKSDSEFDKHVTDVHSLVKKEIKKAVKEADAQQKQGGGSGRSHRDSYGYDAGFNDSRPHIPVTTKFDTTEDHSGKGNAGAYGALVRAVNPQVRPVTRKLERILQAKSRTKVRMEQERGGICRRSLSKLAADKNFRYVFEEKTRHQSRDVAVEMMIDMSGSMGGSKIELAKKTATCLAEALTSLGIKFEVTGSYSDSGGKISSYARTVGGGTDRFNRTSVEIRYHVFKSFDCQSLTGIEKMYSAGCNTDAEFVMWAAKRLAARKEARKILFVLSDGMPSGSDDDAILCSALRKYAKEIEKSGIEVVAFGINSDAPKKFYENFVIIQNVSELPTTVLNRIAKMLE